MGRGGGGALSRARAKASAAVLRRRGWEGTRWERTHTIQRRVNALDICARKLVEPRAKQRAKQLLERDWNEEAHRSRNGACFDSRWVSTAAEMEDGQRASGRVEVRCGCRMFCWPGRRVDWQTGALPLSGTLYLLHCCGSAVSLQMYLSTSDDGGGRSGPSPMSSTRCKLSYCCSTTLVGIRSCSDAACWEGLLPAGRKQTTCCALCFSG